MGQANFGVLAQLVAMVALTIAGICASRWAWRRVVLPVWAWLTEAGTVRRAAVMGSLGAIGVLVAVRLWFLVAIVALVTVVGVLFSAAMDEISKWGGRGRLGGKAEKGGQR